MAHDTWFDKPSVKNADEFTGMIKNISDWYDAHDTIVNLRTKRIWGTLNDVGYLESVRLRSCYNVKAFLVNGQPYQTPDEMFSDIAEGKLLISKDNADHPIMTPMETYVGRIWHDLTHYSIKSDFSYTGEYATYNQQWNLLKGLYSDQSVNDVRYALYLDIVCQVASGSVYKQFPVQKVF